MEKRIVNKAFFKDLTHLSDNSHTQSTIFIKGCEIYKFIKPKYLSGKEETITNLDKIYNSDIAYPTSLLYDKKGFLGYTMFYYRNYKQIEKILEDENVPFEDRKEIAIKLSKLFNFLEKKNFAYDDIQEKNILVDGTDIKLIDIDSGIFKDKTNKEEFDARIRVEELRLAKMILAILHQIPYHYIEYIFKGKEKQILNYIPKELLDFYNYVFNSKYNHFEPDQYVELFNKDIIETTRLILK